MRRVETVCASEGLMALVSQQPCDPFISKPRPDDTPTIDAYCSPLTSLTREQLIMMDDEWKLDGTEDQELVR